jgi:hypothetical protein
VKTKHMKSKNALPIRVPFSAIPPGETPEISEWAQRVVWTDRMLSTLLENKVRGGKWHTLIDKVSHDYHASNVGQMITLRKRVCLVCWRPTIVSDNPTRDTTDRRAVCGRPARTVRREGSPAQPDFPTPINLSPLCGWGIDTLFPWADTHGSNLSSCRRVAARGTDMRLLS